ncbi:CBO0543 family protein [Halobacillus seohaensis]|uniref:CBO0543 family protein n=1 Tax=Halobacillus seohaensis TaxID=447421 RepID=A0ABW2EJ89_9BACI
MRGKNLNLTLVILVIILSLIKGDWKNWEHYYPTMIYISLATFLYEFISHSHFHLWELQQDSIFNLMNVHFSHNLIINPLVAFIFLSSYPSVFKKQLIYTLKWIVVFLILEWGGKEFGVLTYHNGWHYGWSSLFVVLMFPMIRIHHVNKLLALILSVLCALFYLVVFDYI